MRTMLPSLVVLGVLVGGVLVAFRNQDRPAAVVPSSPTSKAESKSQVQFNQDAAEAGARLLKVLQRAREEWEERTAQTVGLLEARLEVGYLTDLQAKVLRLHIKTLRRIHTAALAQIAAIEQSAENLADANKQASSAMRLERFKQLEREWVEAATECNRQLQAVGL